MPDDTARFGRTFSSAGGRTIARDVSEFDQSLADPQPPRLPRRPVPVVLDAARPISIEAGVRQWTAREQGQALEVLGHAIEYLVDSRLVQFEQESTVGDGDAVRLLIAASREVFEESPVQVPVASRLRRWLYERVMAVAA